MLSPIQKKIAIAFLGMVVLHAFIAVQEWHLVRVGFPDFSIFYTAGTILKQGDGARLYDEDLQEAVQRSFAPAVAERGSILPFNHPPFEAVFFLPFVTVPYMWAYYLFLALNLALLVGLVKLLRQSLPRLGQLPFWFWMLACLGFAPIFVALIQGQDSIFLLGCYVVALFAVEKDRDFLAGCALALGLCKFHLLVPFVVPFFVFGRKKVIAGFLTVAAVLGLIGFFAVGWDGLMRYPAFVWHAEHSTRYHWNVLHGDTPNLRGTFLTLAKGADPKVVDGVVILASLVLLGIATAAWRKRFAAGVSANRWLFSISILVSVLVSFHAYIQDLSILLLPLALALEEMYEGSPLAPRARLLLYACIAALFCSPLYLILILRFSQLQYLTLILLAFFVVCLSVIRRLTPRPAFR
jgi:Glycosyltransferase family 87